MPLRDLIINLPSTLVNVSINMANQKWDLYKGEIERLYIHEDQKLEDVMSFMETQHLWKKRQARSIKLSNIAAD